MGCSRYIEVYDSIPWKGFDEPVIVAPPSCMQEALVKAMDMLKRGETDRVAVGNFLVGGGFEGVYLESRDGKLRIVYTVHGTHESSSVEPAKDAVDKDGVEVHPDYNEATGTWAAVAEYDEEKTMPATDEDVKKLIDHILEMMDKLQEVADEAFDDVFEPVNAYA